MKNILFVLLVFVYSCGKKENNVKMYELKQDSLTSFVNNKSYPESPNASVDKFIVNNDYPIELALYSDNRFYYNLPNLGDGHGTWKYQDGKVVLKAKRSLFDMIIEVKAADFDASNLAIFFIDRHGPNTLKMLNVNMD